MTIETTLLFMAFVASVAMLCVIAYDRLTLRQASASPSISEADYLSQLENSETVHYAPDQFLNILSENVKMANAMITHGYLVTAKHTPLSIRFVFSKGNFAKEMIIMVSEQPLFCYIEVKPLLSMVA